jgi:hypothetical protein
MIYSLYIINRAGGLIYHTDFRPGLNKLSANEYLMLAGTVHGVFAIASKITPTALKLKGNSQGKSGLRAIETSSFTMFISQTVTGIKFLLIASPSTDDLERAIEAADAVLQKVYCLYADYVMKNPFHSLEMPIRARLFDRKVTELIMSI